MFLKTAEPIQFTKSIQNIVVSEHQSATFECEVSFDDAVVTWYKGPTELRESPKYSFRSEGRCHYMTIHNVNAEDEGKKMHGTFVLAPFFIWGFFFLFFVWF